MKRTPSKARVYKHPPITLSYFETLYTVNIFYSLTIIVRVKRLFFENHEYELRPI